MIRRILNAYAIEYIKYARQPLTFVGPILVIILVLLAPLSYPLERDGISDYGFIAYTLPMALNLFGFLMILLFSASLISTELSAGTIRTILVRPLRRTELLAAKTLIAMTYALILTLSASITVWTLVYFFGDLSGVEYGGELIYTNADMQIAFIIAALLNILTQFAGVAWALMFSTLTKNTATAIGLAIGSWLTLDFLKHPLNIEPFLFSTYLEQSWTVFAERCDAFDPGYFPQTYYAIAASTSAIILCLTTAGWILNRRNLGS